MTDWYLLTPKTRPNMLGGFENQAFCDYKEDAFMEALETDMASTVTIYNADLSESQVIRCIIQDRTADTQLKTLDRTAFFPIGTVKAGMYVLFEDVYWLISGYPGNNGIYEKATLSICQSKLKWQMSNGEIVERWAYFTTASKYDTGHTGNNTITLTSNAFTFWIPEDDIGETIDGKRVFIDRDTENPDKVFEVTRSDDVLYLFGTHGGILSFIATKSEFDADTDRSDIGICDYIEPEVIEESIPDSERHSHLQSYINGGRVLRCGKAKTWTFTCKDAYEEHDIHPDIVWRVVSDFEISQTVSDYEIELYVEDKSVIGRTFTLQAILNEYKSSDDEDTGLWVLAEVEISVVTML